MSNKIGRQKKQHVNAGTEITGQIMEYILAVVIMAVCVVVPLYARDGYRQIGNAKYAAYKSIMITGFSVLLALTALYLFFWQKEKSKWSVSLTDLFVMAYLVLSGFSVISGGFYEDALWGCNGWNMGLLSQISFVLLYLFISRFGKYYRLMMYVLCGTAAVVFFIGILHRMMIDPIGFYEGLADYQKAQFLSTLGQATWYASFLAVTLPVGIAVFLYTEKRVLRVLGGVYVFLGFSTLVTQNSDSAYFALAGCMLVFFWVSVENGDYLERFLWISVLFFTAGKVMYFLLQIHPNPALEYDVMTEFILCSPGSWILLGVCLAACAALYIRRHVKGCTGRKDSMDRLRRGVLFAAAAALAGIVAVIYLNARGALPEALSEKLGKISYFNWNDDWGNGRGRIWSFAVRMYGQESLLHKLFGVGPDCFNAYVSAYHSEEAALLWGEKLLTNAHNEWLSMLINGGLFGAAAYIGIFMTAVCRFLKAASGRGGIACGADSAYGTERMMLTGIAAAVVSYMAYNFFCYQQVLCTPFIFILMGIGEYITVTDGKSIREGKRKG